MSKRTGQWVGDGIAQTLTSHSAGSVAQVISLLPTSSIVEVAGNVVFERCIVDIQLRRLLTSDIEGCGYLIWDGDVLSGTTTPVESLDPLSLSTFSWAHKSIMSKGGLDVPANIPVGNAATVQISGEVINTQLDIAVKRSISRRNQQVQLVIRADLSNVLKVFVTWRSYYTYAR